MTYIVTIRSCAVVLKLTYKGGKFQKMEVKKGTLEGERLKQIGLLVPPLENLIEEWQGTWGDRVTYREEEANPPSLYALFLDEWFAFYYRQFSLSPKFTGADGNALKQIITYLTSNSADETEALSTWQYLLQNWQKLDEFHQRNTDLKYINSQLNKILQNAKRGNSSKTQRISDDSPNNCLMHSVTIKGVSDALSRNTVSLVEIKKGKGQAFLRSYIALWLIELNELLNLKNPLSEAQITLCTEQIITDYPFLKISELSLIFKRIVSCEFGELYERISMPKLMSIFRKYEQERTEVVTSESQQDHERFRYQENRTESYDDEMTRWYKKIRKF